MNREIRVQPEVAFAHPLWWLALALLISNDHVFKGGGVLPGELTGKLSDFAGMVVAPPLVACALRVKRRGGLLLCMGAVASSFSLLNLWPPACEALAARSALLGIPIRIWCDPSDLIALPALLGNWFWLREAPTQPRRRSDAVGKPILHYTAVLIGGFACLATSTAPPRVVSPTQGSGSGKIFASSTYGGPVHVIDAETGRRLTQLELGSDSSSPWLASGGRIYVADGEQGVRSIDVRSEQVVFNTRIECKSCPMQLALGHERLFAFALHPGDARHPATRWVFALDRGTGKVRWYHRLERSADLEEDSHSPFELGSDSSVVADGLLIVPLLRGLLRLDVQTGSEHPLIFAERPRWLRVHAGHVFFVGSQSELVQVRLETGVRVWRHELTLTANESFWALPFGIRGDLLVYSEAGRLTAVDIATKQRRWRLSFASELLAIGEEIALVQLDERHYAAIALEDGRQLWRRDQNFFFAERPVFREGLLLVRSSPQVLRAYEALSGHQRWVLDMRGQ